MSEENIKIAREYFVRADHGRPDTLELFHEDAEIYFPKFGFGFGRNSFFEMIKGFEGGLGIHSTRLRPFEFYSFRRLSGR